MRTILTTVLLFGTGVPGIMAQAPTPEPKASSKSEAWRKQLDSGRLLMPYEQPANQFSPHRIWKRLPGDSRRFPLPDPTGDFMLTPRKVIVAPPKAGLCSVPLLPVPIEVAGTMVQVQPPRPMAAMPNVEMPAPPCEDHNTPAPPPVKK